MTILRTVCIAVCSWALLSVEGMAGSVSEYVGPPEITLNSYSSGPFSNQTSALFSGTCNRYVKTVTWSNKLSGLSGSTGVDGLQWVLSAPMSEGTNWYTICGVNKTGVAVCVSATAIRVIPRPKLDLPVSSLSFNGVIGAPSPTGTHFSVSNTGAKDLVYQAASQRGWIACSTSGTVAPGASKSVWCSVVTTGLMYGTTNGSIRVTSNGGTQLVAVAVTMREPTYHWTGGAGSDGWAERYNWSDLVVPTGASDNIYFDYPESEHVALDVDSAREVRRLQIGSGFGRALLIGGQALSLAESSGYALKVLGGSGVTRHAFSNDVTFRSGNIYIGSLYEVLFAGDVALAGGNTALKGGGTMVLGGSGASRRWAGSFSVEASTLAAAGSVSLEGSAELSADLSSRLVLSAGGAADVAELSVTNAAAGSSVLDMKGTLELNASADRSDQVNSGHNGVVLGTNSVLQFHNDGAIDTYSYTLVTADSVSGRFEFVEAPYSHVVNYAPGLVTAGPRYPWTDSTGNHSWNSGFNWVIPGNGAPTPNAPLSINAAYNPTMLIVTSGYARSASFYGNGTALVKGSTTGAVLRIATTPRGEPFVQADSNTQVNLDIDVQCPTNAYVWLRKQSGVSFQRELGDASTERLIVRGSGTCQINSNAFLRSLDVQGGSLEGSGRIHGSTVIGRAGELSPGDGVGSNCFDHLDVAGTVRIDGDGTTVDTVAVLTNLVLRSGASLELNGTMSSSRVYSVMTCASRAGEFSSYKGFPATSRLRYEGQQITLYTVLGATEHLLAGAWSRTEVIEVIVDSNEVWFVDSDASWLRCGHGTSGKGSIFVPIEIDRNTNLTERTGTIMIAGVKYVVRQYGLFRPRNDFDGDGISDIGCYAPDTAQWYFYKSSEGFLTTQFGMTDAYPVSGDFDGDGRCDYGTFHPASGLWHINKSSSGEWITRFGYEGTVPVVGDFDGDGIADFGCYYADTGHWYVYTGRGGFWQNKFGFAGTVPITGDFDGDGRCDFGCYYAKGGQWFVYRTMEGFWVNAFGYEGTMPITGDFDGDGKGDFGCYYPPQGYWYIYQSKDGFWVNQFGYDNTYPITGDYDGDRQCDFGCYYAPQGYWYTYGTSSGFFVRQFGYEGTIPLGQ